MPGDVTDARPRPLRARRRAATVHDQARQALDDLRVHLAAMPLPAVAAGPWPPACSTVADLAAIHLETLERIVDDHEAL